MEVHEADLVYRLQVFGGDAEEPEVLKTLGQTSLHRDSVLEGKTSGERKERRLAIRTKKTTVRATSSSQTRYVG